MEDQLPTLEKLLIGEMRHQARVQKGAAGFTWYYTAGWAARLARARMGVREDIERCLELVESVQDANERVLRLFHDVGYIRQPQAIEYLKTYFLSDLRLPPTNSGELGEPVANYLMPILANALRDFPVASREGRTYSEEERETCRKWMAEQKGWDIIR
jgi:hypothetical protein